MTGRRRLVSRQSESRSAPGFRCPWGTWGGRRPARGTAVRAGNCARRCSTLGPQGGARDAARLWAASRQWVPKHQEEVYHKGMMTTTMLTIGMATSKSHVTLADTHSHIVTAQPS